MFLADVTTNHYLDIIRDTQLHPLFPQFILYDIIPLCPFSTQKANLFSSLFQKVSFMASVQGSIKRFGSEIN